MRKREKKRKGGNARDTFKKEMGFHNVNVLGRNNVGNLRNISSRRRCLFTAD